jgi:hypothetical protein
MSTRPAKNKERRRLRPYRGESMDSNEGQRTARGRHAEHRKCNLQSVKVRDVLENSPDSLEMTLFRVRRSV